MEGKSLRSVYTGSLIMFLLVVGQIQVEAKAKACCRKLWSATCAKNCIGYGFDLNYCAAQCGCKLTDEDQCHSRWAALPSESAAEATVVDYCKMGCTSSVCNQMITDATSEVKKDNVMKYCGIACHQFCTKGAGTATATLAA
ncbi:alpha-hordothionin-like isoform X1 [Panicum hallii]|nr:alpha-hordothionin-like isoform X1 [Panicum hallii]